MGFTCGIVGLPNVGKSTIFNALTRAGIEAENYPFNTIEPNIGVVNVPDIRLDYLKQCINPQNVVHTFIEFVDIAGLVRGASKGEGLGNQFLGHIRQVDAIAHVVRCFDDENIIHVDGKPDPVRDIETINTELLLSDYEILDKNRQKFAKMAKSGDAKTKDLHKLFEDVCSFVGAGGSVRSYILENPNSNDVLKGYGLITLKPLMYVANTDEDGLKSDNDFVKVLREYASKESASVVKLCGKIESELSELSEEESKEFFNGLGIGESGLSTMIRTGYSLLSLITFFTAGEKEVRAWTIKKGDVASTAAGKIHSDIERGFIRAETVSYKDFEEYKSLQKVKDAGKMRLEGKMYEVQDGDIMHFRFNV